MNKMNGSIACGVIVLAAGQGKRMRSPLPKVLHPICGKPMLFHVLERVREVAPLASVAIVVGHGREQVEDYIKSEPQFKKMKISMIVQSEQKGTGHAARCAMDSPWGDQRVQEKSSVLVLPGDLPLISNELVSQLLAPLKKNESLRLLTCELENPTGYGRVIRKGKKGEVLGIIEEKDATTKVKTIKEVGTSIYLFQSEFLQTALQKISNNNAQNEYYLTDVIARSVKIKKKIQVLRWNNKDELRGVNDLWELSQAEKILNERIIKYWAMQGVRFLAPSQTWMDVTVKLAEGVNVGPGVILSGATMVGKGTMVGPYSILKDAIVKENVLIKAGTVIEKSQVGEESHIGPYAHLRPESQVDQKVKLGNFVELKKTTVGEASSIAHLSYLGDAEVGKNVNIGCGFVTCNFDGRVIDGERKHRTIIEDNVFLGSDCQTVAPVRIGRGAYVASGSTITEDVEPEALAIARSRQVNKAEYAKKLKSNS